MTDHHDDFTPDAMRFPAPSARDQERPGNAVTPAMTAHVMDDGVTGRPYRLPVGTGPAWDVGLGPVSRPVRPLHPATLERIARGFARFNARAQPPFRVDGTISHNQTGAAPPCAPFTAAGSRRGNACPSCGEPLLWCDYGQGNPSRHLICSGSGDDAADCTTKPRAGNCRLCGRFRDNAVDFMGLTDDGVCRDCEAD